MEVIKQMSFDSDFISFTDVLVTFLNEVTGNSAKSTLRKGLLWITVWRYSSTWWERHGGRNLRWLIIASTVGKQRVVSVGGNLPFSLLFSLGQQTMERYCPQLGWVFTPH